jgi:hypothetical protein
MRDVLHEIARAARSAAMSSGDEWSSSISVPGRYLCGEVHEPFQVATVPVPCVIPGELCRVYLNFSGDEVAALMLKASLIYELEPFIIGVGKICCYPTPDGIVILRRDIWEQKFVEACHDFRS